MINKKYPKYVKVNDTDILLAIRTGMNPMKQWYDKKHHDLPYFWNYINGPEYGNSHHRSYSCVHSTGRWLDALVNAQEITGDNVSEEIYKKLEYWAYAVFDNETRMMSNLNPDTFQWEKVCDLHNLREAMYAFAALIRKNPENRKAKQAAEHLIDMVNRYTDFETGNWKNELYEQECGGVTECGASNDYEVYRFSSTLGRYIGGLVRLYYVYPLEKALNQAIRLTDTAFRTVLLEDGAFDTDRFASHLHSTSSMISGIAMLGDLTGDMKILERVKAFMENGFYDTALEFGWCLENVNRPDDMVGEINNTGDYVEACLCLGRAGYTEFFDRADRMIRCHLLPSQLLDISFISNEENEDDSKRLMAERMQGAFGFPCPYGHEYAPGSLISFNWDIVGGGVSSLCWAYRNIVSEKNNILSVNLLFDYEDSRIAFESPYQHDGRMKLKLKNQKTVRILFPAGTKWSILFGILEEKNIAFLRKDNWVYLYGIEELEIPVEFESEKRDYLFRQNKLQVCFCGNRITAMGSEGKRLCFFRDSEEEKQ